MVSNDRSGEISVSAECDMSASSIHVVDTKGISNLPGYPIDMSVYLTLPYCVFDAVGIPHYVDSYGYHPTTITHYALAHWNQYLATREECRLDTFLKQA